MKKIAYITSLCIFLLNTAMPVNGQGDSGPLIQIDTNYGKIVLKLYNATPKHRDNMLKLVREGYYDKQLFHRVISDFMIQGGDPQSVSAKKGARLGHGGPGYTIEAEIRPELIHKRGALAAARESDHQNPERRSSGSQFYIVQGRVFTPKELQILARQKGMVFEQNAVETYTTIGGTPHLDGAYTVFGELIEGMEVVDLIASLPTDRFDRPLEDVIYHIKVLP